MLFFVNFRAVEKILRQFFFTWQTALPHYGAIFQNISHRFGSKKKYAKNALAKKKQFMREKNILLASIY